MWSDQCLDVDGCSFGDGLEGQHHCLKSDAAATGSQFRSWVMEGGVSFLTRIWKDCKHARCSVFDTLQRFSCRGWESSQEWVANVQVGDDQCLDQELRCVFCEERPDPANVVEGKSEVSGHGSDVGSSGQSSVEDYAQIPHRSSKGHTLTSLTAEMSAKYS